jgi:hypothetical protein
MTPKVGEFWKVNWKPVPSYVIILEDVIDSSDVLVYDIYGECKNVEPWFPNTVDLWEKL